MYSPMPEPADKVLIAEPSSRLSGENIEDLEPLRFPEIESDEEVLGSKKIEISPADEDDDIDAEVGADEKKLSNNDIRDEISGQMKLF